MFKKTLLNVLPGPLTLRFCDFHSSYSTVTTAGLSQQHVNRTLSGIDWVFASSKNSFVELNAQGDAIRSWSLLGFAILSGINAISL